MSVKVPINRFIVPSKYAALRVINQVSDFQRLGQRLVICAEVAQDFRHIEKLEDLGTILSNIPIEEYQHIGQYYLGWCGYRKGQNTQASFETVVEQSDAFRTKAFLSLAGLEIANSNYSDAVRFYQEAAKWSQNPSTFILAAKGIAVFKAQEGSHETALKELQALYPIARYSTDRVYYDYLNSLSVELCETGNITEAQNVSRIVLASPYISAYPEWRETDNEIDLKAYKSHSVSVADIQPFAEYIPTQETPLNTNEDNKEDNVIKFPHSVDIEKLEQEEQERFHAEMQKAFELSDNCTLHDFMQDIFLGGMTPDRFGKFLMKMSDFRDIKMLLDVIDSMLHQTYLNTNQHKEAEEQWRESLLETHNS